MLREKNPTKIIKKIYNFEGHIVFLKKVFSVRCILFILNPSVESLADVILRN